MKLLLATDAWAPQVNGVVRTWEKVTRILAEEGHDVVVVHPGRFRTVPCPTYPEIRLAVLPGRKIGRLVAAERPDAIHVATEGPIGLATRNHCASHDLPFTTSFHTKFPEYVQERFGIPARFGYSFLRWFHGRARRTLVATPSVASELTSHGFEHLVPWTRGVDLDLFDPRKRRGLRLEAPVFLYVGRVAVEKNLEAFLTLDLPGSKLVVGDGPQREELARRFPDVHFAGARFGEDLARSYASADVFCFPSRTDTFGLVLLEALASGVPVAAFPVPGPLDVIGDAPVGVLDEDLGAACKRALAIPREACREYAACFSWSRCARVALEAFEPMVSVRSAG